MKNNIVCIAILAVLFVSCSKSSTPPVSMAILGKWQFLYSKGGFTGRDSSGLPPGQTLQYVFTSNRYQQISNGVMVKQGSYTIKNEKTIFAVDPRPVIRFEASSMASMIEIRNDSMFLSDNAYDAYGHLFIRVK